MHRRPAHLVHLIVRETEGRFIRAVERELNPLGDAPDQLPKRRHIPDEADAQIGPAALIDVVGRKDEVTNAQPGAHDVGLALHVEEDRPARRAAGGHDAGLFGQHQNASTNTGLR